MKKIVMMVLAAMAIGTANAQSSLTSTLAKEAAKAAVNSAVSGCDQQFRQPPVCSLPQVR